jgi:hypothetical protein
MTIEGSFYKITPINESSQFFDLELLYYIGGKNPRKEFKVASYGITLESAIQKIINFAVRSKLPETVTLKEYLDEYKKESNSIKAELKGA